jgi:hypothetical protein
VPIEDRKGPVAMTLELHKYSNRLMIRRGSNQERTSDIAASIFAWNDGCLDAIAIAFGLVLDLAPFPNPRGSAERRDRGASLRTPST